MLCERESACMAFVINRAAAYCIFCGLYMYCVRRNNSLKKVRLEKLCMNGRERMQGFVMTNGGPCLPCVMTP